MSALFGRGDRCPECGQRKKHWAGCSRGEHVAHAPADWDHESHCTVDECSRPATHRVLTGVVPQPPNEVTPVYELVCCLHAARVQ